MDLSFLSEMVCWELKKPIVRCGGYRWNSLAVAGSTARPPATPRVSQWIVGRRRICGGYLQNLLWLPFLAIPEGPANKTNKSRSKISIPAWHVQSRSKINLDRKFQSSGVSIYGALLVSQRRARSNISIHNRSLEIFNPEGRDRTFSIPGPSPEGLRHSN